MCFFAVHLNPLWLACSKGHVAVTKLIHDLNPDLLTNTNPSPLWIACSNMNLDCAKYLLSKMEGGQIDQVSPDGTTSLMQLFANADRHERMAAEIEGIIIDNTPSKFELIQVLEASIVFGNTRVLEKILSQQILQHSDIEHLAELGAQCEDIKVLDLIFKKWPELKAFCQKLDYSYQSREMYSFLDISLPPTETVSELVAMSRKFPRYNEAVEVSMEPLPPDLSSISLEEDIEPHCKGEFCTFKSFQSRRANAIQSIPISKWKPTPCHGKHQR